MNFLKSKVLRKKYLINPKFQFFMISFALFQFVSTVGFLFLLNSYFFNRFNVMGIDSGIPSNHAYFKFLSEQQIVFNHAVLLTSIVIGIVIMTSVLFISHKIAGPLYRLTKHFKEIADGKDLKEIQFRKNDFFPEIQIGFNSVILKLQKDKNQEHEDKSKYPVGA